jgi:type IV pilus biogenesis protein CpaD/CtpE
MTRMIPVLLLPALLALTGCARLEPFTTPGTWRATGANDANLRAMAANPTDLRAGVAARSSRADAAAAAIAQLRAGQRPALAQAAGTPTPVGGQDAPR